MSIESTANEQRDSVAVQRLVRRCYVAKFREVQMQVCPRCSHHIFQETKDGSLSCWMCGLIQTQNTKIRQPHQPGAKVANTKEE